MRLMLVWKMARKLPRVMVTMVMATSIAHHSLLKSGLPSAPAENTRMKTAKPAAFEAVETKAVTGAGAPS